MQRGGLHETVKTVQVVPPGTFTATLDTYNNTTSAAAGGVDTQGFDELLTELSLGAMTGVMNVALYDSATDDGTAATAITDSASVAAAFATLGSSDDNETRLIRIRCKDTKRYVFVRVTNADASSKAFGVNVILGGADKEPVTQENAVNFSHGTP